AMHSHLFGQIMDLDPDRRAGRRTLAGVLGAGPAKWLLVALLAAEAALIWMWAGDPWLAAFLAASAVWFTLDVTLLWRDRPYSPGEMRLSFLGWNAVARSEEHTSELQSLRHLVCRLLLEKKNKNHNT